MAKCKLCMESVKEDENRYLCSITGTVYEQTKDFTCMNYLKDERTDPEDNRKELFEELFGDVVRKISEIKEEAITHSISVGNKLITNDVKIQIKFFYHKNRDDVYMVLYFPDYVCQNLIIPRLSKLMEFTMMETDYGYAKNGFKTIAIFRILKYYLDTLIAKTKDDTIDTIIDIISEDSKERWVKCVVCDRQLKYKNVERHMETIHKLDIKLVDAYDFVTIL